MDNTESGAESPPTTGSMSTAPVIYRLTISQFRGIKSLEWYPEKGVNIILGGGDVGKTTILDAIGLLLSPTNAVNLSDTDYHLRDITAEFTIEATLSLPLAGTVNQQFKPAWPWDWNGTEAVVPSTAGDKSASGEPVYRVRVRGTAELETAFEILQPDGTADAFSVGFRRSIGLVRLAGDDRSDRDLRLVHGSALDRLLSDKTLRSRIATDLSDVDVHDRLDSTGKQAMVNLDKAFAKQNLPSDLDISLTGGPGASIASLIGLRAKTGGVRLPLVNWGAGTRRLSALAIAQQNQGEHPVVLVDEIERGLEPYRQRVLLEKIQVGKSQAFITTHSPAVISAGSKAAVWYVGHAGQIGPLEASKIAMHRKKDPDTFLSRITIIAEGITEVGFVTVLLEAAFGSPLLELGVHVSDGGGNDTTLDLLEALAKGGLCFGGFADDEGTNPTRWKNVMRMNGKLVFRWDSGCLEKNIIDAVADDKIEAFLTDPDGEETGERLRTLADRLNMVEKDFESVKVVAGSRLRTLIFEAATGVVPADKVDEKKKYKGHAKHWFKTAQGGRELAEKIFALGAWPTLTPELLPFLNAVRNAIGFPDIPDISV